jgi:HEAT repeat protein
VDDIDLIQVLRRDSRAESSEVRQRVARILMERTDPEALELLVELAGDPDWRVRKSAIEALEANPTERVVRSLIPALYDPENAGRRNAAIEALRAIGARSLPHLLAELGGEPSADHRIAIAAVLGEVGSAQAFEALVRLVADPDVNVAATAIVSLGKLGRLDAVAPLLRVLSGDNAWLHYHAIEALGRLRATEALTFIVELDGNPALKNAILEAAGSIGGFGAIDLLSARLARANLPDYALLRAFRLVDDAPRPAILARRERDYLRRKFREAAPPSAAGALEAALARTEREDRKLDLLRAMGWVGATGSLPVVLSYLSTECSEAAERALADFGADAEPALRALLSRGADEQKIEIALKLLSRSASPGLLAGLLDLLDHDAPLVRRAAVELLGEIGDPRAADYLLAHLADGDGGVDAAVVEASRALAAADEDVRRLFGRRLRRAAASRDALERANALSLLAEIQPEAFLAQAPAASKDIDAVVRARALQLAGRSGAHALLPVLRQAVADDNAHVRQAALSALSELGPDDSASAATIAAGLDDEDLWVRVAACRALGACGAEGRAPRLCEIARHGAPPERIAALEALGRGGAAEGWPALALALEDPDIEIRQAALAAASRLDAPEADAEIDRRVADPDWRLRATALEALGRRGRRSARGVLRRALLEDPDDVAARSALSSLEALAEAEDIGVLASALSRPALADDVAGALLRLRDRFAEEIELAWRDADPRAAAVLAEVLRGDPAP